MTRGSITGQVKALSMIIAMQNFIPDRHAVSEKKSPTAPAQPQIYASAWQPKQEATTMEPPPSPAPPAQASREAEEAPPDPGHSHSTFANNFSPSKPQPPSPYVPIPASIPDLRVPFSIKMNPFVHRR
jgi:hypothetical protein